MSKLNVELTLIASSFVMDGQATLVCAPVDYDKIAKWMSDIKDLEAKVKQLEKDVERLERVF